MRDDDPPIARVLEVASSAVPLLERARGLVESLDRWLPVDAIWMTLSDPGSRVWATVGRPGLEQPVLDYLDRPSPARERALADLRARRSPVRALELPASLDAHPTWADCRIPTDFRDGLAVPLVEAGGPSLGTLSLLFSRTDPPTARTRERLGQLAPVIARGVSPTRSLLASARLVQGASSGVVLLRDGSSYRLPGLADPVLVTGWSRVEDVARCALLAGQVYRTFVWPAQESLRGPSHARVSVLAATDLPSFVLGTVLVSRDADCSNLTARELEVLGLMVDGRSNQQIAHQLGIASRTVATHVEHILHKLDVPTRTMAAVRAERAGCYVPASSAN